ncbi:MAG TPA: LytTR family transcriptional regulator [Saprospiraceae bacterium]|nr:LytTR family transcriptional regulator [Saprospiraceae bacterium]
MLIILKFHPIFMLILSWEYCFNLVLKIVLMLNRSHIFVKNGSSLICLLVDDIYWIEADARKVILHCKDEVIVASSSMSKVVDALEGTPIMRIHKSYAINVDLIENVKYGQAHLKGKSINVGRKYLAILRERMKK